MKIDLVRDADDLLLPLMKSIYSNVDRCVIRGQSCFFVAGVGCLIFGAVVVVVLVDGVGVGVGVVVGVIVRLPWFGLLVLLL